MIWARSSRPSADRAAGAALAACAALIFTAASAARAQETRVESRPAAPDTVEAHLASAKADLENGDVRSARHHADRAQVLAPRDPRAATWVGHVLFRMGEDAADASGAAGVLVRATFADAGTAYDEAAELGAEPYATGFWAAEAHQRAGSADKALAALLDDLSERGLLKDTLIAWVGEFGRKPNITPGNAGREHWPFCYSGLLAGGGILGGTVYGASDSQGGYPQDLPVSPQDYAATVYQALGITPDQTLPDPENRPRKFCEGRAVSALFG